MTGVEGRNNRLALAVVRVGADIVVEELAVDGIVAEGQAVDDIVVGVVAVADGRRVLAL